MNFQTVNVNQQGTLIQPSPTAAPAAADPNIGIPVAAFFNGNTNAALHALLPFGNNPPLPYRKPVTFYLQDRNGSKIQPSDPSFQLGYMFQMRINPSNFNISLPPKTVVPIRTMGGWKLQYWYSELGSIKADGIIGNMLEAYNTDLKDSDAWRSFRKLIKVYTQNGIPYTAPGTSNRRFTQNAFAPIAVCIFDQFQYYGYFETLEYTESEETPNTIKYNFSFKFVSVADLGDVPGMTSESQVGSSLATIAPQSLLNNLVDTSKSF